MKDNRTSAYTYFEELEKSSDFLNFVLNNITCAVLLLNKDMELQAFNEPLKSMFMNKKDEHLLYERCGEAIGCAHQIEEKKECGKTSKCCTCGMRIDSLESYATKKTIYRKSLIRSFYKVDGTKEKKHLIYSVKPLYFKGDYYLIVLVEITKTYPATILTSD